MRFVFPRGTDLTFFSTGGSRVHFTNSLPHLGHLMEGHSFEIGYLKGGVPSEGLCPVLNS
jgi:hypothetical protein